MSAEVDTLRAPIVDLARERDEAHRRAEQCERLVRAWDSIVLVAAILGGAAAGQVLSMIRGLL